MANYVLTLALKTELWQEHILEKRLNIARMKFTSLYVFSESSNFYFDDGDL